MADVKWIKITTDIFDDEKILLIESLPDANAIIVVWFKLLCLAGKMNNSGVFMMNDKLAYTDKMLSTIFRMKESTVQLALQTFEQFGMIEMIDGVITIPNWNKHQSLDALENKRKYQKELMRKRRAEQKLLCNPNSDTNSDANSDTNVSITEIEEEKEEEKNKKKKHKYGEFQHVLLTDTEYVNLSTAYGDELRDKAIKFLDEYIEEKGYKSKSHNLAIRRWVIQAVKDQEAKNAKKFTRQEPIPSYMKKSSFNNFQQNQYDFDEIENDLLANGVKTAGNDAAVKAKADALKKKLGGEL